MTTITVPAKEWRELNEKVEDLCRIVEKKLLTRTWVTMAEFLSLTNKTRNAAEALFKLDQYKHMKRTVKGIGVQINYKEYQKVFQ